MSRNLITITFSNDQLNKVDTAIGSLEQEWHDLIALSAESRRKATKMGKKSETFCRQTLGAMKLYPHVIPASIDVQDAEADLLALDQLRPRIQRLRGLIERAIDTELALGADVMAAALQGYRQLKTAGKTEGLKAVSKELGERFAKASRPAPEVPVAQ